MLKRIITSIVAVCVLVPVLFLSHTWVFPIAIAIVSVVCLFEMFKCMGLDKKLSVTIPAYLIALLLPTLQRLEIAGTKVIAAATVLCVVYLVYLFALVVWSHGKFTYNQMAASALTSFYIMLAMNMILFIRDFNEDGQFLYLLIFIGAWMTDIFAYFTGVFFGKHKLIEDVSPKKTIEGSIGGIVFCALSFVALGVVADIFFDRNANLVFLAISGVFISMIAQVGDLIMSVIKRHYGIKDYGKIFPGHGGMLDRFDSILSVTLGVAAMCMVSYIFGISMM
ncbi:MAG: phosphatidate cytidylyltransferase [Clostridia bacterium]|nr:phosphatidate cytidylyltransferase [Clostridia bacterium]